MNLYRMGMLLQDQILLLPKGLLLLSLPLPLELEVYNPNHLLFFNSMTRDNHLPLDLAGQELNKLTQTH